MKIMISLAVLLIVIGSLAAATSTVQAGDNKVKSTAVLLDAGPGPIRYSPFIKVKKSKTELRRHGDEIWAKFKTDRLPPGAYTNWWVVFNNPAGCADVAPVTCGGEDFMPEEEDGGPAGTSVLWATGGVVGDNGKGKFKAHLKEGLENAPGEVLWGPGLTDAMNAEIHYIIRFHGPTNTQDIPAEAARMTTSVDGGCNNAGAMAGNFACWDPQATIFPFANGN